MPEARDTVQERCIQDLSTEHSRQGSVEERACIHGIEKEVWLSSVFGRGEESEGRDFGEQVRSGGLLLGLETLISMRGKGGHSPTPRFARND